MSPLVSPAQLTALRGVAYHGLDSTATVTRQTQVETAFGSESSWTTISTGTPCWVRGVNIPSVVTTGSMREVVIGAFRIHFEQDADVRANDRVTVDGDGSVYDIIDMNRENTIQIFRTAIGKKVE